MFELEEGETLAAIDFSTFEYDADERVAGTWWFAMTDPDIDLLDALRAAAKHTIEREGAEEIEGWVGVGPHVCNWGDILNIAEDAVLAERGIRALNTPIPDRHYTVDHDETPFWNETFAYENTEEDE